MSRLRLYLFGAPRIERDDQPVTTDTRKALALIAYLAITRQRHSRDTLATLLWPDYDQPHARATLRRTLSALNKALTSGWLSIERETIGLNQQPDFWLDVGVFQSYLDQCRTHSHPISETCPACLLPLSKAVALYTDNFMAGFSLPDSSGFDDWQFYQADTLLRDLSGALERLVLSYSARSEFDTAITYARRLLTLDHLHEPAHRYLMQLYSWSGQRASAIHQYQECMKILDEELGVPPLETTTSLFELIKENRLPFPDPSENQYVLEEGTADPTLSFANPNSTLPGSGYPLVGREKEWTELLNVYTECSSGGQIVAFEGEAGIGKTRLAEDFVAYARARGAHTVMVRCYEGEKDLAYGPIAAGLRIAIKQQPDSHWVQKIAPHWLSETSRLLPEVSTLVANLPMPSPLDSPGAQSRFFEGLRQTWLALCASILPGVVLFDDIHWADETSLEFLGYMARRLSEKPICLFLTWRSTPRETVQRLQRSVTEAQHKGKGRLLFLARLEQSMVEQLVQQLQSAEIEPSPQITLRLYQETEGVPLFLTEYLTAIMNGVITVEDDDWSLPGGVRDLLSSRLAVVNDTSKQLLSTAAVIGRSFDFDTLHEVSGRSEEEAVTGLEELIGQGLIEEIRKLHQPETGPLPAHRRHHLSIEISPIYDFCHEKLRGLVYDEITLARRHLLHRRTAETLIVQARGQHETGPFAGQIARHYQSAGKSDAAAHYFLSAGEYARSLYAHTEALAHFRAALALGHPNGAYLQETIGDLHVLLGSYEAALKSYQRAEPLSEGPLIHARLQQRQGTIHERRGNWEQAEKLFSAALHILEQNGYVKEQAMIYDDWSLSAYRSGQITHALVLAQRAFELAEAVSDDRALAQAHNMLGILANHQGDSTNAHFHLEHSLALAERLQDISIRTAILNNLALTCKASGNFERAIALTETALALCSSQGDRHREAALHSNLADLFHETGQTMAAMDQLKIAVRIYTEIDVEAGTMQPEIWKLVEW